LAGGGSYTGGTGDIKPQILTFATGVAPAVAQYVTNQLAFPVPRFGTSSKKATITEILWVDWYIGLADLGDTSQTQLAFLSTNAGIRSDGDACTSATFTADVIDPTVFAAVMDNITLTTSGSTKHMLPIRVDLTDQNGNGLLIATDRLAIYGGNIGGTNASDYIAKIAYRLVDVGIEEYVGILASQQ